jgi:hypothetical protein
MEGENFSKGHNLDPDVEIKSSIWSNRPTTGILSSQEEEEVIFQPRIWDFPSLGTASAAIFNTHVILAFRSKIDQRPQIHTFRSGLDVKVLVNRWAGGRHQDLP